MILTASAKRSVISLCFENVHSPIKEVDLQNISLDDICVLVVDDEESVRDVVTKALRFEGWQVYAAASSAEALEILRDIRDQGKRAVDVGVFDILLPDMQGTQLLLNARTEGFDFPSLFLTALDATEDRVHGLMIGADDYLSKPFSIEELTARLRSLVRRARLGVDEQEPALLRVGDLTINEDSYEVSRGDKSIHLTSTEFELLRYFMRNPGKVLNKMQILDRVWSYEYKGRVSVVELYISYLRRKIDGGGRKPMLHTVRGVGYKLTE